MDATTFTRELELRTGFKRSLQLILIVSLFVNAVLGIAVLTVDRTVRTVFVPPTINKSFWVEDEKISPEYLEQMGLFLTELLINVTPGSVEYQNAITLKYVSPSNYGEMERYLKANANKIKTDNISTSFSIRSAQIDDTGRRVAFTGMLDTWVADKRVSIVPKCYLLAFEYSGGRITIKEFRETSDATPFAPPQPSNGNQ